MLFVVLMVGVLGGLFTLLSLAMCESMAQVGMSWLYFTIMTLLAAFFRHIRQRFQYLFHPSTWPRIMTCCCRCLIPVRTIMAARLVSVYLMGLMYSAVVLLPAIIVYWVVVGIGSCGSRLHDPAAPSVRFVLTLSCALGWVVAKISQKLKNKSFITVLMSLVFIGRTTSSMPKPRAF